MFLNEKRNNQLIEQHNQEVAQSGGRVAERAMKAKHQAPNKIMREVVEERFPGYIAEAVRRGAADDPSVKARFENDPKLGIGPGVYDALVREEKARQGAKS